MYAPLDSTPGQEQPPVSFHLFPRGALKRCCCVSASNVAHLDRNGRLFPRCALPALGRSPLAQLPGGFRLQPGYLQVRRRPNAGLLLLPQNAGRQGVRLGVAADHAAALVGAGVAAGGQRGLDRPAKQQSTDEMQAPKAARNFQACASVLAGRMMACF